MKTLKITPPEGFEIDKEKSTFEEIVFKPVKKQLPKSWKELKTIEGFFVTHDCTIYEAAPQNTNDYQRNIFATEEQAKASIALAQLSQLREVYRGAWVPDWYNVDQIKHCIIRLDGKIDTSVLFRSAHFLSFQSPEIIDEFLENFRDLIEEASPLLFG